MNAWDLKDDPFGSTETWRCWVCYNQTWMCLRGRFLSQFRASGSCCLQSLLVLWSVEDSMPRSLVQSDGVQVPPDSWHVWHSNDCTVCDCATNSFCHKRVPVFLPAELLENWLLLTCSSFRPELPKCSAGFATCWATMRKQKSHSESSGGPQSQTVGWINNNVLQYPCKRDGLIL